MLATARSRSNSGGGVERVGIETNDEAQERGRLGRAPAPCQDVRRHVPHAQVGLAADLRSGRKPPEETKGLLEATHVCQGRSSDHDGLGARLAR